MPCWPTNTAGLHISLLLITFHKARRAPRKIVNLTALGVTRHCAWLWTLAPVNIVPLLPLLPLLHWCQFTRNPLKSLPLLTNTPLQCICCILINISIRQCQGYSPLHSSSTGLPSSCRSHPNRVLVTHTPTLLITSIRHLEHTVNSLGQTTKCALFVWILVSRTIHPSEG